MILCIGTPEDFFLFSFGSKVLIEIGIDALGRAIEQRLIEGKNVLILARIIYIV
jgi:hypothetical protein